MKDAISCVIVKSGAGSIHQNNPDDPLINRSLTVPPPVPVLVVVIPLLALHLLVLLDEALGPEDDRVHDRNPRALTTPHSPLRRSRIW